MRPNTFPTFSIVFTVKQGGTDDDNGSGLGLSIVQSAVAALRGRVVVESEPGKGSVFRVALRLGDGG